MSPLASCFQTKLLSQQGLLAVLELVLVRVASQIQIWSASLELAFPSSSRDPYVRQISVHTPYISSREVVSHLLCLAMVSLLSVDLGFSKESGLSPIIDIGRFPWTVNIRALMPAILWGKVRLKGSASSKEHDLNIRTNPYTHRHSRTYCWLSTRAV